MHELSVTESLLEIALRHGQGANAQRITRLYLVIGELSTIVDDSIQFYWDIIARDTAAEGAQLAFRRVATQIECLECGHQYHPVDGEFACPHCSGEQIKVVAGEEFFLEAIDVET